MFQLFIVSHTHIYLGWHPLLLFVMIALLGFTINKGWINIILFYCNLLSILYGYMISVRYGGTGLFVPSALLSWQIGAYIFSLLYYVDPGEQDRVAAC